MARIKLDPPINIIAKIKIQVRITDINYGNHLGNDSLVSILHEARVQWLKGMGYTELDIEGVSLILNELVVNYRSESFLGDVLEIGLSLGDFFESGFELYYEVVTHRNETVILIARAKTNLVCYDYIQKKVVELPFSFKSKC